MKTPSKKAVAATAKPSKKSSPIVASVPKSFDLRPRVKMTPNQRFDRFNVWLEPDTKSERAEKIFVRLMQGKGKPDDIFGTSFSVDDEMSIAKLLSEAGFVVRVDVGITVIGLEARAASRAYIESARYKNALRSKLIA